MLLRIFCCFWCLLPLGLAAQFSRQDTLRGQLSAVRACYDVEAYTLYLRVFPDSQAIRGYCRMEVKAVEDFDQVQIDLFEQMKIDSIVTTGGQQLRYRREGNAVFVYFPVTQPAGRRLEWTVHYGGRPIVAANAPWDGGFTWARDPKNRHWVATSCEGIGASLWWPNKDHLSDEPLRMNLFYEVPDHLMAVGNGNLIRSTATRPGWKLWHWAVSYPINNYNVTLNIGPYSHIQDRYIAADGDTLALDYYVLDQHVEKAHRHFEQVKPMLRCFEEKFGKYPFWNDGYALVETPFWGMEHQGAIAYGNNYQNNEWDFDYIIIHESGHEYFGNSLSVNDHAEMWIHESFTTYTEMVYVECMKDKATAIRYLNGQKAFIKNTEPILGPLDVNYQDWEGSDMYYKGSCLLHQIRTMLDDDVRWWKILREFAEVHRLQHLTTPQVTTWFEKATGLPLGPVFDQYLRFAELPVLRWKMLGTGKKARWVYRWEADVPGFEMPVRVNLGKGMQWVKPTTNWQEIPVQAKKFRFQADTDNFYIQVRKEP